MNLFNRKSENLEKLLQQSKQDFNFDQETVKNRLLYSLRDAPIKAPAPTFLIKRLMQFSVSIATVLIFVSATFVFASSAQPGDKLFALNKFGEKMILSLPLSVERKANLQTRIVNKRLKSLETVKIDEVRQLKTVKESDESLTKAIESVAKNKRKLKARGQTKAAGHLDQVLNQLDDLAEQHEKRIHAIEATVPDPAGKETIREHLDEIKNARIKARAEIKLGE